MPVLEDYKAKDFFAEKAKKAYIRSRPQKEVGRGFFDILAAEGTLPSNGILLHIVFIKGKVHGVGHIVMYDMIEKISLMDNGEKADLILKGKSLYFSVEDKDYALRLTEPFNRTEPESHIPFTAGNLKVMSTMQEGRAFIQDVPKHGEHHLRINNYPRGMYHTEEISMYFEQDSMEDFKTVFLKKMENDVGLLKMDAEYIAKEMIKRILE